MDVTPFLVNMYILLPNCVLVRELFVRVKEFFIISEVKRKENYHEKTS